MICWNRDDGRVYKSRVSLTGDAVETWDEIEDGQPNMTVDEFHECDEALRKDPRVIEALAARGITDMDRVLIDTWAYGAHLVPEQHRGGRVGWADVWYRKEPGSSPYANPVTGLHFVVDLNQMELLEVEDTHRVDEPATMGEYVPHLVPGLRQRSDLKPLEITQPEGASFTLDGNLLTWQKWSLRIGFNHREGLVLHTLAYDDRSVAHRLSFAEMVVPYRDPTTDHYRRTAFDIGEWGLGFMTTSLELGCDCLGEITYVDAVMHDTKGEPYTTPRKAASSPTGSSSGATPAPNRWRRSSSVRSKLARSRSSLLTKIMRGTLTLLPRACHGASVCTSTASHRAGNEYREISDPQRGVDVAQEIRVPGVSSRLTLWSSYSNGASASEREMLRFTSSGSKSVVVEAVLDPSLPVDGARGSRAAPPRGVVLPDPPCPTRAMFRILAGGRFSPGASLTICFGDGMSPD